MNWFLNITMVLITFWSPEDYSAYDIEEFFAREDVHQTIDLKKADLRLMEAALFYATNEVRKQCGKDVFENAQILQIAARKHSEDMLQHNFVDHINRRDRKNRTPMDRVENAGGKYMAVSENLAQVNVFQLGEGGAFLISPEGELLGKDGEPLKTFTYAELARKAVTNWMNSPPHRENLLSDHKWLGCGVSDISYTSNGLAIIHLTQNFAKN